MEAEEEGRGADVPSPLGWLLHPEGPPRRGGEERKPPQKLGEAFLFGPLTVGQKVCR